MDTNDFVTSANKLLSTLEQVAEKYSQPVTEAALSVIWFNALHTFLVNLFLLVILAVLVVRGISWSRSSKNADEPAEILIQGACILIVVGMAVSTFRFSTMLALYDPKLYLVYSILNKML